MIKWLKILITGFLVSCFYFPVIYKFFPIANTKNLMAAFGLVQSIAMHPATDSGDEAETEK